MGSRHFLTHYDVNENVIHLDHNVAGSWLQYLIDSGSAIGTGGQVDRWTGGQVS